ncbi:MAG TPA: hypothetical protein VES20_06020 [Bryobacteraceae bacterium]|nr:hypothetical protein [Bryobacteraceae bacterium]
MPERIYKLQPDRTLSLRGFDGLGASAAMHTATADGFLVSGVFRDAADFAVLMLHDADNFYEHPRLKHLPDFDFAGLKLKFDVRYTGLMPLESKKFATIDWPFLDVIRADGTKAQIRLSDYATRSGGTLSPAKGSLTIVDGGLKEFDRLTVWYQNLAFDYIVPKVECAFAFFGQGTGTQHTVRVSGVAYTYVERAGDTNTSVAVGVAAALAGCPAVTATQDTSAANQVNIRCKRDDGVGFDVTSGTTTYLLYGIGAGSVATTIAGYINSADWATAGTLIPLIASANGPDLELTASVQGEDGNHLSLYSISRNSRLRTQKTTTALSGGASQGQWTIELDFTALGIPQIRQMWLTFAPPLEVGAELQTTEWKAEFTNWSLAGPETRRRLQVAGPGSVRIEDTDAWCNYAGAWQQVTGFYSEGMARRCTQGGSVTVKYACSSPHYLYIGTTLGRACGKVGVALDGGSPESLNCYLDVDAPVNTRRLLRTSQVAPGEHSVTITAGSGEFYFDFIEAAIPSDVPDALPPNAHVSPALDYSTDHTYKLPPARVQWIFDRLGYAAPMNEYIGVFWWNQRKRRNAVMPEARITFNGPFAAGDALFLKIGKDEPGKPAFAFGKSVFPADTPTTIARHFAQFLNSYSVAVWASAAGNVLTITSRSAGPAYRFPLSLTREPAADSAGKWTIEGSLENGNEGEWEVDPAQEPALNRGARDWHGDMFLECASRSREITVACSMELVNPPQGFGAVYKDGKVVETDVGFGKLKSTHCHFGTAMRDYQKAVFANIATLQKNAGLTPSIQFGEFLWWFFTNKTDANPGGGMAFYDADTAAAAQATLGRPLTGFAKPTDDPLVNGSADANFLRSRLHQHVSALSAHVRSLHADTRIEVLFPYDVNHPEPAGIHKLGGRLNRFINLPAEWEQKGTSGLDRLKTEALDFGAWSRNLDLARTAFLLPVELGWPKDSLRHLVPVFRPGYPWEKEVAMALGAGIPVVNFWAWDHICIYGLAVTSGMKGKAQFIE